MSGDPIINGDAYGELELVYDGEFGNGDNTAVYLYPGGSTFFPELFFALYDDSDSVEIDPGTSVIEEGN